MTESQTLEFENARTLQALYANDIKLLKSLEDSLDVKVTTRDGWMRVEGHPEQVDRARRVFQQLEQARQQGVSIRKHEFSYALKSVKEEEETGLDELVNTKIFCGSRRPPVTAKTAGQRAYIQAIQSHPT